MNTPFTNVARVQNNEDASHCTQFAFMAAVETLGNQRVTLEEAEKATGYQPGGTWPYYMITWFADNGFKVRHFEDTDFNLFLVDPRLEFERQGLDGKTIDLFYAISDFDAEQAALGHILQLRNVEMVNRKPEVDDIVDGLSDGWLPIISLDAATLGGGVKGDFDGHVVLASGYDNSSIRIQDPGPPAKWDFDVSHETLLTALRMPSESSGTVTLVKRVV